MYEQTRGCWKNDITITNKSHNLKRFYSVSENEIFICLKSYKKKNKNSSLKLYPKLNAETSVVT